MSQREELLESKRRAMKLMEAEETWQQASKQSGLNYSKSGIQGLYREWSERGEEALIDRRHGHPYKVTDKVREVIQERCEEEPEVRASQLVEEIKAEFGTELNPNYVTVIRRQLGLGVPKPGHPGKRREAEPEIRERQDTAEEQDFSPRGRRLGPEV